MALASGPGTEREKMVSAYGRDGGLQYAVLKTLAKLLPKVI